MGRFRAAYPGAIPTRINRQDCVLHCYLPGTLRYRGSTQVTWRVTMEAEDITSLVRRRLGALLGPVAVVGHGNILALVFLGVARLGNGCREDRRLIATVVGQPHLEGRDVDGVGLDAETRRIGRVVIVGIDLLPRDRQGEGTREWQRITVRVLASATEVGDGNHLPLVLVEQGREVDPVDHQSLVQPGNGHGFSRSTLGQGVAAGIVNRARMDVAVISDRTGTSLDLVATVVAVAAAVTSLAPLRRRLAVIR
ncbi:uncharacterized protein PG998_008509 [Apiospora kogelbergensis]|uniref:uncharacterized protein n=1 Tax=Apiospora kogelbergensis TaxID=1337665 RepID=UPI0031309765